MFRMNPRYKQYVIIVKEVDTERKDATEGKRVLAVNILGDYLEVDGQVID